MQNAAPTLPWETRALRAPLQLTMHWHEETLKLGEHIVLADTNFDAERVGALFTAAFGGTIALRALPYVKRAVETKRDGATPLALTHLALAGLPTLADPEAAKRRLIAADGLMKRGVSPAEIVAALTTDATVERAYDPDQPRVPAGNGIESGRWTNGDGGASDASPPKGVQVADNSWNWAHYLEVARQSAANAWPGAYYGRLAADALHRGEYSHAALYEASALLDSAMAIVTLGEGSVLSAAKRQAAQLVANKLAGQAAENIVESNIGKVGVDLGNQVTVVSATGNRTRVDFVVRSADTGEVRIIEVKSSQTAPLTPNQTMALPEINSTGGTIVGQGKPGFPSGTRIPPNSVDIIRNPKPKD